MYALKRLFGGAHYRLVVVFVVRSVAFAHLFCKRVRGLNIFSLAEHV